MSPKQKGDNPGGPTVGSKRKVLEKDSLEYKAKRDRNNVAVKKSREKSRAKAKETQERVARLKKENEDLEMKVQLLSKELSVLKDLFLAHASGINSQPDTCPGTQAQVHTKASANVKEEPEPNQESFGVVGSPVNQEGFDNDHEYFGPKTPSVLAK